MITAAGAGSGIDVESIISQLMNLERQPINDLNRKRQQLDVELSAFGSVKSAMSELATTARTLGDSSKLGPFVASSSDEDVFTASVTSGTAAEFHEVEVLALAQNHRLASGAFASVDASVGAGTYSLASGENSFDVTIDATNNSLTGLRDAINDSLDNTSIVASILNVDGGSRLVLTARESGTANSISVNGGALGGNAFSDITAASDAELIVDGFTVTSASNAVSDVISGVTLNIEGLGTAIIDTERDTESLRESLDEFVSKYNTLRENMNSLSDSELQGDRLPRNAESRLRTAFSEQLTLANGATMSPTELGFTFDQYGVLSISDTRLADAQKGSLEKFVDAFTQAETGLAARFEDVLNEYTSAGGLISNREDGINSRQRLIDNQIERYDYRLERAEQRYRRQFGTMDLLVTQLQSTSSFLASRLGGSIGGN
jgi:flagellar hook-associated protein 2